MGGEEGVATDGGGAMAWSAEGKAHALVSKLCVFSDKFNSIQLPKILIESAGQSV
jgi:hypothetical protein